MMLGYGNSHRQQAFISYSKENSKVIPQHAEFDRENPLKNHITAQELIDGN